MARLCGWRWEIAATNTNSGQCQSRAPKPALTLVPCISRLIQPRRNSLNVPFSRRVLLHDTFHIGPADDRASGGIGKDLRPS